MVSKQLSPRTNQKYRRALIAGWFSFEEVIATIGDILGGEMVGQWLDEVGVKWDIAMAPYMQHGVNWREIDASKYDLMVFTTGPLKEYELINELLERFKHCTKWAINISLIHRSMRDKFDQVWERDSLVKVRPDISFVHETEIQPLIAVAFAPPQSEYPAGRHELVKKNITDWIESRQLAAVELDMDMFVHHTYPRRPTQIESIIARCDAVVSMRLHATVLALKHGKPVIATDPVSGGAKVYRQATQLEWPKVILPDDLSQTKLDKALEFCLSSKAVNAVKSSQKQAGAGIKELEEDFKQALLQ